MTSHDERTNSRPERPKHSTQPEKRGSGMKEEESPGAGDVFIYPPSPGPCAPNGLSERRRQRRDSQEPPSTVAIVALLVLAVRQ